MPAPAIKQTAQGMLPSEIFQRSSLEKLAKKIDKALPDALEGIIAVIASADTDPKLKLDACKFVIDSKVRISDAMSKEAMQKAVLLVKSQAASGLRTINSEEPSASFCFDKIAKIEGVNYDATDEDGSIDLTYLKT